MEFSSIFVKSVKSGIGRCYTFCSSSSTVLFAAANRISLFFSTNLCEVHFSTLRSNGTYGKQGIIL
ncbi:MAG: hypothetical protein V9F46_03985 [Chitinophagaceae bacterium]